MRLGVVGCGAVGGRVARTLISWPDLERLVLCDPVLAEPLAIELGEPATVAETIPGGLDAVVVATPHTRHVPVAARAIRWGADVVSVADSVEDITGLLDLDHEARERGRTVVVGGGFAPGFTGVLARHGSTWFDQVDEVHVATFGTGGPACARQHHRALGGRALDYRDDAWVPRPGGSGRELLWFPEPVGGADCYRAALADPILLVPLFSGVRRVTARMAATRRDRVTARLPMLRPPHPEGTIGAVRVELRGTKGTAREVAVLGAAAAPAFAAAVAATVTLEMLMTSRVASTGAQPLAQLIDVADFLERTDRLGIVAERFEGVT